MILDDPTWDYRTTPSISTVTSRWPIGRTSRASARRTPTSPDYVRRGGKLILSGGWNNALVPAGAVLDYYNSVEARIGIENTRRAVRLYMVPGMIECNGGPGTDTFDMLGVMRRWVERGQAPNEVHRVARRARQGRAHAAAVSLPAGGDVPRQREHGRREELRLQIGTTKVTRLRVFALFVVSVIFVVSVHAANGFSSAVGP